MGTMFDSVKALISELLREKEVSLAMIYSRGGKILWHKGRPVEGKTIKTGTGFSKSFINKTLAKADGELINKSNVLLSQKGEKLPNSALGLSLKSVMVLPVKDYFLYVDSGTKEEFSPSDREVFRNIGLLLQDIAKKIEINSSDTGGISGVSESVRHIRELVMTYAIEEEPVLLLGETGSGKSHIAELIHKYSGRPGKFVTVNTPTISENLFESALFGHKKGSFTDARYDKKGFVDEAQGGTLFLDEISEVPISFQSKLLRFIEKQKYNVLGETAERTADVRIIAATNMDLKKAIEDKIFREDLYYRLHILEIEIPPLRDRKEDIKPLVKELMHLLKGKELGENFYEALYNHDWSGNTRELITVLKRLGLKGNPVITGEDVNKQISRPEISDCGDEESQKVELAWTKLKEGTSFWEAVKDPYLNRDLNRDQVKAIVNRALLKTNGKYKPLLVIFNIPSNEYKKFMSFLRHNDLQ